MEVYNDIDGRLVNFFLYLKYHPKALFAEINTIFHSREMFDLYQQEVGETCLQKAARFYFLLKQSYGGKMEDFGYGKYKGGAQFNFIQRMADELKNRLQKCLIEKLEFEILIQKYDGPETFFFLDPPYTSPSSEAYRCKFSISDHHRLARVLKRVKGKWLLGYNDSPFIRRKYKSCFVKTTINKVQTGPGKIGYHKELLIANYDILKPLPHPHRPPRPQGCGR